MKRLGLVPKRQPFVWRPRRAALKTGQNQKQIRIPPFGGFSDSCDVRN
jgi:hypothetical protein